MGIVQMTSRWYVRETKLLIGAADSKFKAPQAPTMLEIVTEVIRVHYGPHHLSLRVALLSAAAEYIRKVLACTYRLRISRLILVLTLQAT